MCPLRSASEVRIHVKPRKNYSHAANVHTVDGARALLSSLLAGTPVNSLLDVGAGNGTWMKIALELGIPRVVGLDGNIPAPEDLHCPPEMIAYEDFTKSFSLNERFDTVLCLEVAEHIPEFAAMTLVESLTRHGDFILFSAACPGQPGEQHVNCQWPRYWQESFNRCGFECSDEVRWQIWDVDAGEPWYRQNIFSAFKSSKAGSEARILSVIHPEMLGFLVAPGLKARLVGLLSRIPGFTRLVRVVHR